MLSLLSKERKILLGVTVIVFLVASALIWQTWKTMQIFNIADAICQGVSTDMGKSDLIKLASNHRVSINFMTDTGQSSQAVLGFTDKTRDDCGCVISIEEGRVSHVGDTYCRSASQ